MYAKAEGKTDVVDITNEIKVLRGIRHPNVVLFLGATFFPSTGPLLVSERQGLLLQLPPDRGDGI